jgi:hypothetical protein
LQGAQCIDVRIVQKTENTNIGGNCTLSPGQEEGKTEFILPGGHRGANTYDTDVIKEVLLK